MSFIEQVTDASCFEWQYDDWEEEWVVGQFTLNLSHDDIFLGRVGDYSLYAQLRIGFYPVSVVANVIDTLVKNYREVV